MLGEHLPRVERSTIGVTSLSLVLFLLRSVSKKCVCSMGRFPDLMKLGAHGGLG